MEIIKGKVNWLNIIRPTKQDINYLKNNFQVHPIILEELMGPSTRSKVEIYNNYLYLVYFFPIYNEAEKSSRQSEIDFIITRKEVITVHYEYFEPLENFKKQLENEHFREKALNKTYYLTYYLLESFIKFFEREQNHIAEKIELINQQMFKGKEDELLKEISYIKRDISEYSMIVHMQETVLKSLANKALPFWRNKDDQTRIFFDDLVGDQTRVLNQVNNLREILNDLERTNSELLTTKINNVMKTLTVLTSFAYPLLLIASIFSMRAESTPFIGRAYDFWIIIGLMILSAFATLFYFKNKKWL